MKTESMHQLRLSVDIRALKEHEFTAQLALRFRAVPSLGLAAFRSQSFPVTNARAEIQLRDCFQSGCFQASAAEMGSKLANGLQIELWHTDRLKSDTLLGKTTIDLSRLLEMPLRTTNQSYARVLDAFHAVDEVDEQGRAIKTVGSLRVILYLEDLGPVGQLQQRGFNIRDLLEAPQEQEEEVERVENRPAEVAGLNQLERKVVWELETWKKAEEAKARLTLKQKQIEFWTNISQQQRKSDLQKEKQFKKIQANLGLLDGKLKSKLADLVKRQQKLITLQQQLQGKISEVSRECMAKDQEIEALKKRQKQQKASILKEKVQAQAKLEQARLQNANLKAVIEDLKKQDERSPLNIFKAEINSKNLQIKELSRELEKANEVKEEYKAYYGKMKDEVILLREKLRAFEESRHELLRDRKVLENNCAHLQQQLAYERQLYQHHLQAQPQQTNYYQQEAQPTNQRDRMALQRQSLLRQGGYSPDDPLILALDRQIRQLA